VSRSDRSSDNTDNNLDETVYDECNKDNKDTKDREDLLTLDEYCSKKVKDLISSAKLTIEANTPKIIVLGRAAPAYYQLGKIDEKVLNTVTDPRFVRLYKAKVRDLQSMLANSDIGPYPKQGKGAMVKLCYEHGLDVVDYDSHSSDDDNSSSRSSHSSNHSSDSKIGDDTFIKQNGKIYFKQGSNHFEISDGMILRLMSLRFS